MAMDSRLFTVLVKVENTEGTDATPAVGTDDVFVMNDSSGIDSGQSLGTVVGASPTGDAQTQYVQMRQGTASYRIPLYGLGLSTGVIQLPRWAEVLFGSFCDIVIGSSDSTSAVIRPNLANPQTTDDGDSVTSNKKTFTVYEWKGVDGTLAGGTKTLTKLIGARVSSVTLDFPVGDLCVATFNFVGRPVTVASDTTDLSGWTGETTRDFITPNAFQTQLTPNGGAAIDTCMSSLSLNMDLAGAHIMGDCEDATGVAGTALGAITLTGSIDPLLASGDISTWMNDINACDYFTLSSSEIHPLTRSANTGYGVVVDAGIVHANFTQADTGRPEMRLPLEIAVMEPHDSSNGFTLTLQ